MTTSTVEKETKKFIKTIAIAGNPNSGKTTLFNAFTKLKQKVGNYPGVTVEKKMGELVLAKDRVVNVIDLPGTYSLAVRSMDEQIAHDVLLGKEKSTQKPDVVVCVVDAGNLERNLYLVSQIQDMQIPIVVALNMMDEAKRQGKRIDVRKLSSLLGAPVVPMVAKRQEGMDEMKQVVANGVEASYQRQWKMSPDMEEEIENVVKLLVEQSGMSRPEAFGDAVRLLSQANLPREEDVKSGRYSSDFVKVLRNIQKRLTGKGVRCRSAAIEARYGWIKWVVHQTVVDKNIKKNVITQKIDAVLTHKFLGLGIFVALMGFMFYLIFFLAAYPMGWIEAGFEGLASLIAANMPPGDLQGLMTNGIIAGVGGVLVFLPQILILYFFISLLQDTGYMSRAAFMMDRLMSKVGLHGKSFIPLLSSFACAIPGVMASRTIENPKDRLVTILVAPLMSCSARLPVYTIMIAALIPEATAWEKARVMLGMYLLGILGACLMAWLFKKTLLKSQRPVFLLELPPYRRPSFRAVIMHMWERSRLFLRRAGTIILTLSIVLWVLMTYPKSDSLEPGEALRGSYAGQLGQFIEPAIKPLGYDWRIGIGLIGSFAAREVFVSTMNIVFNLSEEAETDTLREAFAKAHWPDGRPLFTPLVCISLMIFFVFALQCVSTLVIVARETGGWGWPFFQLSYMTVLAYVAAFIVYQGGRIFGFT